MASFGAVLRALRLERGYTLDELAALAGTSKQVLSRYENDQRAPKVSAASHLAAVLGVSLDVLINPSSISSTSENSSPTQGGEEDPSPDQLTAEESKFLSIFSRLSPENQKLLLASAAVFLQAQGESPDPPV